MKLYKLAAKYHERLDVIARYIRSLGVPIDGISDESIPDYVLPQLEQNFGSSTDEIVPYQSASPSSKYMVWRKDIHLIYQDIVEMTSRCQFGKILDRRVLLFKSILSRIKEYPLHHPDLKNDMEAIVSELAVKNDENLRKLERRDFFSAAEELSGISENGLRILGRLKTIIGTKDERVARAAAEVSSSLKDKGPNGATKVYKPSTYISYYNDSNLKNWLQDLPLIHKDVCELIDLLHDNRAIKDYNGMKGLLSSVLTKIVSASSSQKNNNASIESTINELLVDCEQRIEHYKEQYFESRKKSNYEKWIQMASIKSLYLAKHEEAPQETSKEIDIPWVDVYFDDGQISIDNRELGKWKFPLTQSRKVFNLFSKAISNRIPPLKIHFNGKKTPEIVNTPVLDEVFLYLSIRYRITLGDLLVYHDLKDFIKKSHIDFGQEFLPKDRTPYFQFLVEHQCPQYRFVPLFEKQQKQEDACLFTIKGNKTYIIWENININTATYVFPINETHYDEALQAIYDYACSEIDYKRHRIRLGLSLGAFGLATIVINHLDYKQWTSELSKYL